MDDNAKASIALIQTAGSRDEDASYGHELMFYRRRERAIESELDYLMDDCVVAIMQICKSSNIVVNDLHLVVLLICMILVID